jgi:ATP-independent RNA helicase DbpA
MQAKGDLDVIIKPEEAYPYTAEERPEEEFPEY